MLTALFEARETLTQTAEQMFGGTQAQGAYTPKDASDLMELQLNQRIARHPRRYDPTVGAPTARDIVADLSDIVDRLPTQTRRTPETDRFQQFSTPPHYAYVLAWIANMGRKDVVLEPSAGVGGLAVFALNAGAQVYVNELAPRRAELLRQFPFAGVFTENAEQINNILPESVQPTVVLMNPPFSAAPTRMEKVGRMASAMHLQSALHRLSVQGRLVAILGESMAMDRCPGWWDRITKDHIVRANVSVPGSEYRKFGTTYGTQLVVIEKVKPQEPYKAVTAAVDSVVDLIDVLAPIRPRYTAPEPSLFDCLSQPQPPIIGLGGPKSAPVVLAPPSKVEKTVLTDAIFEPYRPQRLQIPGLKPHPTALVQSAAMATILPPEPTYKPALPAEIIDKGLLSDAQLEAVVYAGQAHQQFLEDGSRKGFFIGDGTGVGKGRELCGIILDDFNRHSGPRKAIWITKGPKLFNDALRDWTDLGADGSLLFNLCKIKPQEAIPRPAGILFTTYATLKMGRLTPDKSRVDQIVRWVGPDFDGVICFDESHACKNAATLKEERGTTTASDTALAASDLQKALPKAKVVYASATGATEVENLAYVDRLGLWGKNTAFADKLDFIAKIKSGGVAAMELVARDTKQLGVYLARNLSFEGVQYERLEHALTPDQRDIYDKLVEGWQVVLRNFNEALELIAGYYNKSGHLKVDGKVKSAALSAFWSTHQRFFNQVLISMQMPSVIGDIEQHLAGGNACVLQLVNTNEAAQERQLAKLDPEDDLDGLDLTPRDQLLQMIEHCFPVNQYEQYTDAAGNLRMRLVVDSKGNPVQNREAVAMRERLLSEIASIRVPDGPLEMLLNHFGEEKVAEVTGRSRRVVRMMVDGAEKNVIQTRSPAKCIADVAAFQADKKRVLIFSDAGGTGASYHADHNVINQRRRIHYLVQAGWIADAAVQGFGRTHRSNQVQPPLYKLVSTDLKGQRRFISTIARRLDQLGALTKGQRQAGANGLFRETDNLESQYARDALYRFYCDLDRDKVDGITLAEFEHQTGLVLRDDDGNLKDSLPPITRFLNRLLSLTIDMQNRVFDAYMERLEATVQAAIDNGTFDVGVETIRADKVRKVAEQVVYTDPRTKAETKHVEIRLANRSHPRTFEALMEGKAATFNKPVKFFARNRLSGHVYAFTDDSNKTETKSGRVLSMFRQIGPIHHERVEKDDVMTWGNRIDTDRWEQIPADRARALWDAQVAKVPEFIEKTLHLITGAVLPIWDRLKGNPKVYRLMTDDGERLLGRVVPNESIAATLRNLGVNSNQGFDLADVLQMLMEGTHRFELVNGWNLKASRVNGEIRFELIGPDYRHQEALESDGMFAERINWATRYFIPTGPKAMEVLGRIVAAKPIAEAVRIRG